MAGLLHYLLFLSVMAAITWGPGQCQGVLQRLKDRQREKILLEALDDPDLMDHMLAASKAISNLWTVHFQSVLENSSNRSITAECRESAESIILASLRPNITLFERELMPLLDATGKLGAGLFSGNLIMNAAFEECFEYDYTAYCGVQDVIVPFLPPGLTFTMGLCVPKHCTSQDVATVMNATEMFMVDEDMMRCTDVASPHYNPGAIIMIAICASFAGLVLLGTAVDLLLEYMTEYSSYKRNIRRGFTHHAGSSEDDTSKINDNGSRSGHSIISVENEKTPLLTSPTETGRHANCNHRVKWHEFITAFSLYKTVPTLLSTKQVPGVITSLNGMRVISMFWVILGHSYVLNVAGVDNSSFFTNIISRLSFQAIENALFSVDSFFFLSGVLVAYLTLRQIKKKGRFPFLHYYLHRYLRLTPTYAFVLFFGWFLGNHVVSSAYFSIINPLADACEKYWWTNLLYINNLYPWIMNDQCMAWTWYLANDMQFFVLAPLIIIPLYYLLPLGFVVAGGILFFAFTTTATIAGVYDFQASDLASFAYNYHTNITADYQSLIYEKPWSRIAPYIVGILFGWVLHKNIRFPFGRIKNIPFYFLMWVLSGVLLVSSLYGLYFIWRGHVPSVAENVIYITFSRCAWSVGLALLVFACHNGYGGVINTFLSISIWTPLSRMTFNAYLVHPLILTIIFGQLEKPVHYTDVTLATFCVAFVVFSYAVAAALCVFVEFPLGSIEMLLFKLAGLGGRETQRQGNKNAAEGRKSKPVKGEP
jgi:peptidoglycan/LPS O-acetylase OafA/YrhL